MIEQWCPRDIDGTLHVEQGISGRARLVFQGGRSTRHLFLYGSAFDSILLQDPERCPDFTRLASSFLEEATEALNARPPITFC